MIYIATCKYDKDIVFDGQEVVLTLDEVMRVIVLPECESLEIKKDFAMKYFTPTYLSEFKYIVERFNPKISVKIDSDYNTIINEDIKLISEMSKPEELIDYLLSNREDRFKIIQDLCSKYTKISNETVIANSTLSSLYVSLNEKNQEVETYKNESRNMQLKLEHMKLVYNDLISKIKVMYNVPIDEAKLLGYNIDYNNYTKILYFKELSHVKYTSSMIYYLQEILETIYNVPARLLVIESPYAIKKTRNYRNCKSHLDLTKINVFRDNIAIAGFQSTIVDDVLKNPSGVPYLIVLDRTGWDSEFIKGKDVETVYLSSSFTDVEDTDLPRDRIISDSSDCLQIEEIEGFNLLPIDRKIGNYSSMKIIKELLVILEGK